MAANMTGMRVAGMMVAGTAAKRGGAHGKRIGIAGLLAAILVALLIVGAAMHERGASHPASPATSRTTTTSAETRFLEQNTTTLPDAVATENRPAVVTLEEQRLLDANTTWMPAAAVATSPVIPIEQRKYLEVNTNLPGAAPASYMEQFTPPPGHPR